MCEIVASDLGIGGGISRLVRFLHHLQLGSHDLPLDLSSEVEKEQKNEFHIPYTRIQYGNFEQYLISIA